MLRVITPPSERANKGNMELLEKVGSTATPTIFMSGGIDTIHFKTNGLCKEMPAFAMVCRTGIKTKGADWLAT